MLRCLDLETQYAVAGRGLYRAVDPSGDGQLNISGAREFVKSRIHLSYVWRVQVRIDGYVQYVAHRAMRQLLPVMYIREWLYSA